MTNELGSTPALDYHAATPAGKLLIVPSKPCQTAADLSLAYTPGVAEPCLRIQADPDDAYLYTGKGNSVAVITDGSAVLGLGNLGPLAAKPVMEGKAVLFKRFADIDAVDVEIQRRPGVDFVEFVEAISPTFGGINLEDIAAPDCFDIEARLKQRLEIPVFHDDQHGTAVVIAAGLLSALEIADKKLDAIRIVVNGAGSAAIATIRFLRSLGVGADQITVCDTHGVIHAARDFATAPHKAEFAARTTNRTLSEAMVGSDVFIGVSAARAVTAEMLRTMRTHPIIFALANPTPEIDPELAHSTRPDAIVATGRSDAPNQVNNVLAFPYLFRAALDVRANQINFAMMAAAAKELARLAHSDTARFGPHAIIPSPFDDRLFVDLPLAVAGAAIESGAARHGVDIEVYRRDLVARGESLKARFGSDVD